MGLLRTVAHLYHPRRSNNHRARVLHPEAIATFSVLCLVVFMMVYSASKIPGRLGTVLGYASNISPADVIAQTNQQRQAAGLSALSHNGQLSAAAAAKANDMFAKQYWAHTSPEGTQPWSFIKGAGYSYQVAGENLARDFSVTNEMMDAWMASPTHRANIMSDRYTEIGIAVVNGTLEGVETTLVVQMFGTPRTVTAQVAPAAAVTAGSSPAPTVQPTVKPVAQVASPTPVPTVSPELVAVEQTAVEVDPTPAPVAPQQRVLASALIPQGSLTVPPLFTPLQILKAVFLALIMMLIFTLVYDSVIIGNRQVLRLVGHNLGHVLLFSVIAYLIISFKAGVLG